MSRLARGQTQSKTTRLSVTAMSKTGTSRTGISTGAIKKKTSSTTTQKTVTKPKKAGEFTLPPLSIMGKAKPKGPTEIEKLKKKTIRRNAPEGEDIKKIREIIRNTKNEDITVQEFVGLISPYTGDNGEVLRKVLADDLASFRIMVTKVYDTMTQDVSDVLANEQVQLTDFYRERHAQLTQKMMRAIDEILTLSPNFDFERFYRDPNYINVAFPLVVEVEEDDEEAEMRKRQEAYHRLQWLRSEGERLNQENVRLQARMNELKREQKAALIAAAEKEKEVERRNVELETTQVEMQNHLEDLNQSLEKSIVDHEFELRKERQKAARSKVGQRKSVTQVKSKTSVRGARVKAKPKWNVSAAQDIELAAESENLQSEVSRVSVRSPGKSTMRKQQSKTKVKKKPRETSPFHFSPIKTPPRQQAPKQASPFHYSPPRTPPGFRRSTAPARQASPFHYSPPRSPPPPPPRRQPQRSPPVGAESRRVETTTTVTRELPQARRSLAPRDSWGGFG